MLLASLPEPETLHRAVADRDASFEGLFVYAVRTTGIFCRPTCPARRPRPENIEFFASTRDATLAGYRPCKRCRPLELAGEAPTWVGELLEQLDREPDRRLRDADLRELGLEPVRVRRWFQRHHGMTFHAFQRARRLGNALGQIRQGVDLNQAAYASGFESPSGFREAFGKLFGAPPGKSRGTTRVLVNRLASPLGAMLAAATDEHLVLLEFVDRRMLETQVKRLRAHLGAHFVPGDNEVLAQAQFELAEYFEGTRQSFEVPTLAPGTEFQRATWESLLAIPYGETRTYREQAESIGRPQAMRAIGRANGDNRIAIVIPCHRVLGANGELTGYGGQLWRKRWLLELERERSED